MITQLFNLLYLFVLIYEFNSVLVFYIHLLVFFSNLRKT